MRVVIAGGTGLIGSHLVVDLAADGHDVLVLSRNPGKYQASLPDGATIEQWDAQTAGDLARYIEGADAVVNFAGENLAGEGFLPNRWTADTKRRIRDSRITAGEAVVDALRLTTKRPKVLLQSSAVGYYGPRGDDPIVESSPPGDDFLASVAVEWEASTEPAESLGVRRVIARTGLILTTEGGPLTRLILPYKLYGGVYFGNGRQWWSWIHMTDEIRALHFLLEYDSATGPFNLTAPNPVSNRDFGKALGEAMNRPSYMPVPRFALNLLVGEVSTVVMDGQRAIPQKLEELGFTFQFTDLELALRDVLAN